MNSIIILLSLQVCLLLAFPLVRRLLKFYFSDTNVLKHISVATFCLLNISFPLTILIIFLVSFFRDNIDKITSTFLLFNIKKYSINLGFQITLHQLLFFFSLCILSAIISSYIILSNNSMNNNFPDKFPIFSIMFTLFVFSPNFFQLILFMFVIDILFLDFISSTSMNKDNKNDKSFVHSFLSIITGNLLILIATALLVKRSASFDFEIIANKIQYHFFINRPNFKIMMILLFVGIIAKVSLIPFHTWLKNSCESRNQKIFLIFSIYMPLSLFLILGTPYLMLTPSIQEIITWYGICSAVLIAIITIFLRRKLIL